MGFSQSPILDVTATRRDADLAVAWRSSAPAGSVYQVYLGGRLAWHGTRASCHVPYPRTPVQVEVGVVPASEETADHSASLPAAPGGGRRVTLTWAGGTYLDPAIAGYHVYSGAAPGGAVSYASPVGTVAAYSAGLATDGYGMGGYGAGGYGAAAARYSWTSPPLEPGSWDFAVVPFDSAGNEGALRTTSAAVAGPPRPPARGSDGKRVRYTLGRTAAGGYGTGGYGAGGYGTGGGYGSGGYGAGGYGVGAGAGAPYVTLAWLASPA
jgi:hypothetical protein